MHEIEAEGEKARYMFDGKEGIGKTEEKQDPANNFKRGHGLAESLDPQITNDAGQQRGQERGYNHWNER